MIPTITADISVAKDYLHRLSKRDLPKVVGRSLERTASSGMSFLSRRLRARVALKKSVVDKALSKRRGPNVGSIEALNSGGAWFELRVSGNPIPLRDFSARQGRRGTTYRVSQRGSRKTYRAKGNLAFIVARLGGHVFVRVGADPPGPAKAPIRKVFGPSLPQFFRTRAERDAVIEHCESFWAREVIRNAQFVLNGRR